MRIEQSVSITQVTSPLKSVHALYGTRLVPSSEYEAMEAKIKAGRLAVIDRKKGEQIL